MLVPLDRHAIDLVWDPRGYPSHGDYRDTQPAHAARAPGVGRRRRARTTPSAATPARATHARAFVSESQRARSSPSTPSSSATTGTRASRSWSACSSSPTSCRWTCRPGGRAGRRPADELGRPGATCARGGTGAGGLAWAQRARGAAGAGRERGRRARCASCSRCRAPTGRSRSPTRAPASTRASAPRRHHAAFAARACRATPTRSCATSRRTWRSGRSSSREAQDRRALAPYDHLKMRRCVECRPHKSRVPSGLSGRERGNRWSLGQAPGANRRQ